MIVVKPFFLKCRIVLRVIIILSLFITGCGIPQHKGIALNESPPLSNERVREMILARAMENLSVPQGNNSDVTCSVKAGTQGGDLVKIIATEFLLSHGYRVVLNNLSLPVFSVSVDTLHITLLSGTSRGKGTTVHRFAETHIKVDLINPDGTRQVYSGQGTYDDVFDVRMLDSLDLQKPYVISLSQTDRVKTKVKPFFIGFTMSLLAWMLYSYRG